MLDKQPNDILNLIDGYLDVKTKARLAQSNKFFHQRLINKINLFKDKDITKIISFTNDAIIAYIDFYCRHYSSRYEEYVGVNKTKGSKRAYGFYCILKSETIPLPFKLFSVYALLTEKNGKFLKETIKNTLEKNKLFIQPYKNIIQKHFDITDKELITFCDKMLNQIHHSNLDNLFEGKFILSPWHEQVNALSLLTENNIAWLNAIENNIFSEKLVLKRVDIMP